MVQESRATNAGAGDAARRPRVLVVNGFVREAVGDAALLGVLLEQLQAAFPGCELKIGSLEDPRLHPEFDGWRNLGSCRRYGADETVPRPVRAIRKLFVSAVARWWFTGPESVYRRLARLLPREVRAEIEAVQQSDLVVSVGGGYLNGTADLSGDLSVDSTLAPIRLAGRLGKPIICAPQSFGPFGTARQRRSVKDALGRAQLVLTREAQSFELLQDLGLDPAILRRGVDSAFAFRPGDRGRWREKLSVAPGDVLVGITARQWLDPVAQARYERIIGRLVDHIQQRPGHRAVLIPQVISPLAGEDDRMVNRRIAQSCTGPAPIVLEEFHDHVELKGLYAALDYVVGMRFHSVIFALTSHVPSIAIEYHHKSGGIMADLGLSEWVVKLADVTEERLINLFDRLVSEREAYSRYLREVLPAYTQRAEETAELMREVYERGRSEFSDPRPTAISGPDPIVQVVPYYPPHIGGMEVVAQTIAEGLARDSRVDVLTSTSSPAPVHRCELAGNLRVRRLRTVEFAHVPFMPTLLVHLLRLPRGAAVHVHVAVAYAPEVVWLYSKLRGRPYIAHFHLDVDPSGRFGRLFLLYKRYVLGAVLRSAARVIAVSPDQPEFLARIYGVPNERIELIPNGVGAAFFLGKRAEPEAGRRFRLLFVGRLAVQKNVPLLLNAVAGMSQPVDVRIVGDGEDRPMLEDMVRDLGLDNVRLVGAKVGADLVDQYRWADAFVLTSKKESTGLVLLEAMAAGLPVVATNVVGVRDTVGDDGLLVDPEPTALAETLDRLVADRTLWRDLAERSAERADRHPWTTLLDGLRKVYDDVWG